MQHFTFNFDVKYLCMPINVDYMPISASVCQFMNTIRQQLQDLIVNLCYNIVRQIRKFVLQISGFIRLLTHF